MKQGRQHLPRFRRGWPELTEDTAPLQRIIELSEPLGTRMTISQGRAI